MDERRRHDDLFEIQELFNAITKKAVLDWQQRDKTGLSLNHVLILEILHTEGEQRPSDLAVTLQITTGGITSLSHRLVERKLIDKVADAVDRRVSRLAINDKGREVLSEALRERAAMINRLFGSLADEDICYLKQIGQQLLHEPQE